MEISEAGKNVLRYTNGRKIKPAKKLGRENKTEVQMFIINVHFRIESYVNFNEMYIKPSSTKKLLK